MHFLSKTTFLLGRQMSENGGIALGTCFLSNIPGHLITALHVVGNDDSGLVVLDNGNNDLDGYQKNDTRRMTSIAKIVQADPIRDICILKVEDWTLRSKTIIFPGTDNISVGKSVLCAGFPHANHPRNILTVHQSMIGAKMMVENSGIMTKQLVLNMLSRPGQSGSPIYRVENNEMTSEIVGMLLGTYAKGEAAIKFDEFDPREFNQTSIAVSSEYINDMLNEL